MRWTAFITEYLTFTRKERIGLLVIVLLIFLIWILPKVIPSGKSKSFAADTSWITAAKKLQHENFDQDDDSNANHGGQPVYDKSANDYFDNRSGSLFYFDPNALSDAGWRKLGIREKTISTIQKYLAKGGHFYAPEDLTKIYSLRSDEFTRLKPYIKIERSNDEKDPNYIYTKNEYKEQHQSDHKSGYKVVDVNVADTSTLIALPGIGTKLAGRIISFRDKLGGFYSIDQVAEIYGLPDSTFEKIKPFLKLENISLKKFNLNTASKDEMRSHPYIKWNLANAIVEYRNQHGNFTAVEDLKKLSLITEEVFAKIKPYVVVQ